MSLNQNFEAVWTQIDTDHSGTVNQGEFNKFMVSIYGKLNMEVAESALNDGWKIISKKAVNGEVSKEEVRKYCNLMFTL